MRIEEILYYGRIAILKHNKIMACSGAVRTLNFGNALGVRI